MSVGARGVGRMATRAGIAVAGKAGGKAVANTTKMLGGAVKMLGKVAGPLAVATEMAMAGY